MKKYAILFVLFITSLHLRGQIQIHDDIISTPCEFDSSVIIAKYELWDFFQTEDNTLDGVRLPNCIPVINSRFSTEQLDFTKKLFMTTNSKYIPMGLNANSIYSMVFNLNSSSIFDQNCESCQKVLFYTSMPNATMDGINHEVCDFDLSTPFGSSLLNEICFAAANILDQKLDRVVFEISLDSTANKKTLLRFNGLFGEENPFINLMLSDLTLSQSKFSNKSISLKPSELVIGNFFDFILVTHNKGYPSSLNKDFKEIKIDPNPNEVYDIVIESQFFENIVFQKYTGIRGGLVEGQDSLRHNVELVLEEPWSCFSIIGDLIFGGGSSFRYISGEINLRERNSCLMFKEKSTMTIDQNAQMHYGNKGRGMLALFDAKIEINDSAQFTMDGQIVLKAGLESPHIYLDKNSKIDFTKYAKVWVIDNEDQVVYIHAKADQVDLTQLDADSRSHIIILEEVIKVPEVGELVCYPNPTDGRLYFKGNYDGETCKVMDINGRMVDSELIVNNFIVLSESLDAGMYILRIGKYNAKVVKI